MSGGFKWLKCGDWEVVIDEEGLILAYVVIGFETQPKRAVSAFIKSAKVGDYINADFARAAVEQIMSDKRRMVQFDAGKVLPMDERAWLEEQ